MKILDAEQMRRVDRAARAARAAFPAYSRTSREERLALLQKILGVYMTRYEELARPDQARALTVSAAYDGMEIVL